MNNLFTISAVALSRHGLEGLCFSAMNRPQLDKRELMGGTDVAIPRAPSVHPIVGYKPKLSVKEKRAKKAVKRAAKAAK